MTALDLLKDGLVVSCQPVENGPLDSPEMVAALADADLSDMRFRDRIAHAVQVRLQLCEDKEVVRRGSTLFALPQYAGTGSQLIWGHSRCHLVRAWRHV